MPEKGDAGNDTEYGCCWGIVFWGLTQMGCLGNDGVFRGEWSRLIKGVSLAFMNKSALIADFTHILILRIAVVISIQAEERNRGDEERILHNNSK